MHAPSPGLYKDAYERDSCGFGLIASLDDAPSHALVRTAITSLNRLTHRGAVATDGKTGDGCGLLLKKPAAFLRAVAVEAGITLAREFAAGLVFLPRDAGRARAARTMLEAQLGRAGLSAAGWRTVPVNPEACGPEALRTLPDVEQLFVDCPAELDEAAFNRRLFMARRLTEKALGDDPAFYVPSLSASTLVYKGMVMPRHLAEFYPDLDDPRLAASVVVFHQRFSTNTLPQWRLAHPYRYLAHNGEINTVQGNRNWAAARGPLLRTPLLPELQEVLPLVSLTGSDSQSLDNMLEVLLMGGLDPLHAMRLLIPPAWHGLDALDPDLRAFYEYYSPHMEPWDGPAGIVLTDGRYALCTLDRNGLRPARFVHHARPAADRRLRDRCVGLPPRGRGEEGQARARGHDRPRPRDRHGCFDSADIDQILKSRHPYKSWLQQPACVTSRATWWIARLAAEPMDRDTLALYQKMFNVTQEERDDIIRVLAEDESEAVGSMGDDTPMPVLSHQVRPLYDYFRQQFAQVTNPPIDSLRESIVMSLQTQIGPECNIFEPAPEHARQIVLGSPILSQRKLRQILAIEEVESRVSSTCSTIRRPRTSRPRSSGCATQAESAVREGKLVLLLSDRYLVQRQHAGARPARDRRGAPPPGEDRAALQVQSAGRDRHGARAASLRLPDRLRRHRRVSLHGLSDAVRDDARRARQARLRCAPRARPQLPRAGSARDSSRSCRRWASRRSPATAARSCSRSSGSLTRWSRCASPAPRAACRARTSPISRRTCSALAARAWDPRAARRARAACSSTCTAASTTCTTRT